jgi:hypothetical protein
MLKPKDNSKLVLDAKIEKVEVLLTVDTEIEIIKNHKDLVLGSIFVVSGNVATALINKGLAKIK